MTPLFWGVVALDFALFVILVFLGITDTGHSDGGREMSMIFFVIVPAIIIGGAVLLFMKSESTFWRAIALVIVAGPGLFIGGARVRSAMISHQARELGTGRGYFSEPALKRAAEAVVRGDAAAIDALDKSVDLNTVGDRGMTLMELAVSHTVPDSAAGGSAHLDVVRALLSRGADPNPGLEEATRLSDNAVLRTLLDAGAKPGYATDQGPIVFRWLNVMSLASFTALLDHGLDINHSERYGTSLLVASAEADRWNFVLLLIDRGADMARDAERLRELVKSRQESTSDRPADVKTDIARVDARLKELRTPAPR